jgi:Protein of unknown function (DUF1236)
MRQALLVSVAALALAAGSTIALSQGGGQGGGGAGGAAGGSINANPGTSGGAAGSTSRESQPATEQAPGGQKGAQERTAPSQKSTQQDRPAQPGAQQRQTETPQPGGAKQGAQTGDSKGAAQGKGSAQGKGMASSNVSLTTEQKTTIRNTVINTGPRATSVNFSVRVGIAVPRTVKFAPVPATIVEIQPAWRGYMYFVYEDEIIIVHPRTLKIVAVIEV